MKVLVKRLTDSAIVPHYEHDGDSGMDLYADETIELRPMQRALVRTGISIQVPKGFEAQVRAKSGLALNHGIGLINGIGTIDSGYRGEIKVIAINFGEKNFTIEKGKKIAQLVFLRVENAEIELSEELDGTTRNDGGFGSTGLHKKVKGND